MLSEVTINQFSQLCYLDAAPVAGAGHAATVGDLAAYYGGTAVGKAYMKARFGGIPMEYAGWRAFLEGGVAGIADWRIVNVMDRNRPDETGFYACGYLSPEGELVAAFRGSEMLGNRRYKNDYRTDFSLAYALKTPQQMTAERYITTFDQFRARPYYLTGHSLGGNLALHAAVFAPEPDLMLGCYAFNAPGFNRAYIGENKGAVRVVRPRLHNLQNEHDVVSSLLMNLAKPEVLSSAFDPGDQEDTTAADIFYPHSNFMYRREGDGFVRQPEGKKDLLCTVVNKVSRLFLLLPDFIKRGIADIVLELIYASQTPEQRLEYLLERITKYLVHSGVAESGPGGLAFSTGMFAAKQLWQAHKPDSDLYREAMDPGRGELSKMAGAGLLLLELAQLACTGEECRRAPAGEAGNDSTLMRI